MELTLKQRLNYFPIGFAIFSMFFGAGNSIFPLLIGAQAGDQNFYAVMGMTISTILVPLLGVFGIAFFDGSYKDFFCRLGKIPGFMVITLIMALIGPFAGIPRCITLAFSTLKPYLGSMPLMLFSGLACVVIFFKTIKKRRLVDILGKILTPLLLFCLVIIIFKGIYSPGVTAPSTITTGSKGVFFHGLFKGFQMMDLLASFFFSATVIACVKAQSGEGKSSTQTFLKAATLSGLLLMLVYIGFSYVASSHSKFFQTVPEDALLSAVSHKILGGHFGFVMGLAVALACLTTAITLVTVFSEFIHNECFKEKLPYSICIFATIVCAFSLSNLGFMGICNLIAPALYVCYPALITLTIVNILHKMYDFKPIKWPVYGVFAFSLILNFWMK